MQQEIPVPQNESLPQLAPGEDTSRLSPQRSLAQSHSVAADESFIQPTAITQVARAEGRIDEGLPDIELGVRSAANAIQDPFANTDPQHRIEQTSRPNDLINGHSESHMSISDIGHGIHQIIVPETATISTPTSIRRKKGKGREDQSKVSFRLVSRYHPA